MDSVQPHCIATNHAMASLSMKSAVKRCGRDSCIRKIWSEGLPEWAPCSSLFGLLPSSTEPSVENDKELGRQEASNPTQLMDSALLGNFSHE